MEVVIAYLFFWFAVFPKSFGRHLGVIARAMQEKAEE